MRKIIYGDVGLSRLHLTELFDLSDVEVTGDFNCNGNSLISLKGSPHTVGKSFRCHSNNLTSLKGGPHTVGYDYYCDGNNLRSLEGIPKTVGGYFYIDKALEDKFPEEYIRSLCVIKGELLYY